MAKRKTVKLSEVAERVNAMLALSDDDAVEGRKALAVLLERLLMDAEQYRGFHYTVGVHGEKDDTRRHYYCADN